MKLPHPLWDGLQHKVENGDCDYGNVNAMIRGLVRYSFFAPQRHYVTGEMEKWRDADQDLIDDLCEELAKRPEVHLCGQFLERVAERGGSEGPGRDSAQDAARDTGDSEAPEEARRASGIFEHPNLRIMKHTLLITLSALTLLSSAECATTYVGRAVVVSSPNSLLAVGDELSFTFPLDFDVHYRDANRILGYSIDGIATNSGGFGFARGSDRGLTFSIGDGILDWSIAPEELGLVDGFANQQVQNGDLWLGVVETSFQGGSHVVADGINDSMRDIFGDQIDFDDFGSADMELTFIFKSTEKFAGRTQLTVTSFAPVPEPATGALLLMCAVFAGTRRRRNCRFV